MPLTEYAPGDSVPGKGVSAMKSRTRKGLAAALVACASWYAGTVVGQTAQQNPLPPEKTPTPGGAPAGLGAGPIIFHPGVDFGIGHDDNLFFRNTNKKSSTFRVFSPYVRLEGVPKPHKFDLLMRLDDGRYNSSPDDNYDDYTLLGNADLVFSGRTGLKVHAEHRRSHDPRGSTDRPFGEHPDVYKNTGAAGVFGYGAPGAQGRIELDAGYFQKRYQNNREFTEANDYDSGTAGGTFLWRVQPKTQLLFQAQRTSFDYKLSSSTLDLDEDRFYFGARWEAAAKTDGTLKIGRLKKDFRDASRNDISTGNWDVGMRWSPLTYSVLDLATSKQTTESTGFGDTIITKNHSLTWSHDWSSRVRTQLLGNLRNDDFRGAAVSREDDTRTIGARVTYQFRRWLRFGLEYAHTNRDSNVEGLDYKRNLILFTVGAML